jgi:transcription initiation factor TFIIIB Brf1 subunit/transcription initiation factor TFIIB
MLDPQYYCCQENVILDQHTGEEVCTQCGMTYPYLFVPVQTNLTEVPDQPEEKLTSGTAAKWHEEELREVCAKLNLSQEICSSATTLYMEQAIKQKSKSFAAYCLYRACCLAGVPRSLKELSGVFGIPVREIARLKNKAERRQEALIKPSDLAARACSKLGISDFSLVEAIKGEADRLFENELGSAAPQSALAVAIAFIVDSLSHASISNHCQVAKQTLTRHYKRIKRQQKQFETVVLQDLSHHQQEIINTPTFYYATKTVSNSSSSTQA